MSASSSVNSGHDPCRGWYERQLKRRHVVIAIEHDPSGVRRLAFIVACRSEAEEACNLAASSQPEEAVPSDMTLYCPVNCVAESNARVAPSPSIRAFRRPEKPAAAELLYT